MTILQKPLKFPLVVKSFQPLLSQLPVLVSPETVENKKNYFYFPHHNRTHI